MSKRRSTTQGMHGKLEADRGEGADPEEEFIRAHARGNGNGGKARADISIYGQESNDTTWRLARMNLALRGIDGQIAHGDPIE